MSHRLFADAVKTVLAERARTAGWQMDVHHGHVFAQSTAWVDALWEPLRVDARTWITAREQHAKLHHLQSSQLFALNLFGPLRSGYLWARRLWTRWCAPIERVEFEWPRVGDPLGERTRIKTQVDVRIDHTDGTVTLTEVKLTEEDFGDCSAARNEKNEYRALSCEVPFASFAQLHEACYLARRHRRDYFLRLGRGTSLIDEIRIGRLHGATGCPLRGGLYQVARNLMMAQYIVEEEARRARVAIVAPGPELHPILHAHGRGTPLREYLRAVLKPDQREVLDVIAFEEIVDAARELGDSAAAWAKHMTVWYVEPLRAGAHALVAP